MATAPFVLFVCLHGSAKSVIASQYCLRLAADVERASRVVAFGCDLSNLAPASMAIERWDDVPAVSEDCGRARDAIVARVRQLADQLGNA